MAIRRGDVEVVRSGMSSLMEAALQQEAAFNDPFVQAMKLGTEISETYQTAMQIKPKLDNFMEGIRDRGSIGPEGDAAIKSAVSLDNVAEPFTQEMIKGQLGTGYMEGVDYEMDAVTGQYKPVVDVNPFGTFGKVDMSVKAPEVDMSKFPDQTDKIEGAFARAKSEEELQVSIFGINNAANAINNFESLPYRYYGKDRPSPFRGPITTPDGKINFLNLLDSPFGAIRYLAGPTNTENE